MRDLLTNVALMDEEEEIITFLVKTFNTHTEKIMPKHAVLVFDVPVGYIPEATAALLHYMDIKFLFEQNNLTYFLYTDVAYREPQKPKLFKKFQKMPQFFLSFNTKRKNRIFKIK